MQAVAPECCNEQRNRQYESRNSPDRLVEKARRARLPIPMPSRKRATRLATPLASVSALARRPERFERRRLARGDVHHHRRERLRVRADRCADVRATAAPTTPSRILAPNITWQSPWNSPDPSAPCTRLACTVRQQASPGLRWYWWPCPSSNRRPRPPKYVTAATSSDRA